MRRMLIAGIGAALLVAAGCVPPAEPPPELCAPGTFSATGEAPCTPAPAGTFVDTEGATGATPCPIGTFQGQEGQTSCELAAPGTFVDVEGATAASPCELGELQPAAGAVSCLLAPIGTYVDTLGAATATDCPPGTTTETEGATSVDDCAESLLAVAYSNLDGIDGYDPTSTDVLIAKLVDTNLDGTVSIGDTINTNQYPLDLDATAFGTFGTTAHTITTVLNTTDQSAGVQNAAGNFFVFGTGEFTSGLATSETYREFGPRDDGTGNEVRVTIDDANGAGGDGLLAAQPAPSDPGTGVAFASVTRPGDDPFIDVDFL